MLSAMPMQSEASFASDALAKARAVMQSAFQLSFLNKLPVIFYKDSFNTMFAYTNRSIDEMNIKYGNRTITANEFESDKALHIKKSAELALHIKSLIGSAHLAYGITMAIGLIKEAIDSSFLNPNGSRSKKDLYADHVGARAVFGQKKFDASLNKHLGNFVKSEAPASQPASSQSSGTTAANAGSSELAQVNPFTLNQPLQVGAAAVNTVVNSAATRQQLLKRYYEATEKGDAAQMKSLSAELKALP